MANGRRKPYAVNDSAAAPGSGVSGGGAGASSSANGKPVAVANGKPGTRTQAQNRQLWSGWDATQPYTKKFQAPKRRGAPGGGRGGQGKVSSVGEFEYDEMAFDQYGKRFDDRLSADTYQSRDFTGRYDYADFDRGGRFQGPQEEAFNAGFQAPTGAEAAASPGYDFRLREGQRAIENAASAQGMVRTGNTWKDLMKYGQDYATAEYDKTYGRARSEHDLSYGRAQDRYGRALGEHQMGFQEDAQAWQMNQQNQLAQYDRSFQAQQANEANRLGAQQLSEASRSGAFGANLGAFGANIGAHQADFGIASGVWDRNYMGGQQQYDYRLQRAMEEQRSADAAAGRRESAYASDYNRAMQQYLMDYEISEENQRKKYQREREYEADMNTYYPLGN